MCVHVCGMTMMSFGHQLVSAWHPLVSRGRGEEYAVSAGTRWIPWASGEEKLPPLSLPSYVYNLVFYVRVSVYVQLTYVRVCYAANVTLYSLSIYLCRLRRLTAAA